MTPTIVRSLYRVSVLVASLPLFPIFLCSTRGRKRIGDRYGLWGLSLDDCGWFHGASVGEINALLPVIAAVKKLRPDLPILLTATSYTGLERAQGIVDHARLLPFDAPAWVRSALRSVRPRFFICGEAEVWPTLLEELANRKVPLFLVNARMSERSFARFRSLRPIIAPILARLSGVMAATARAAERYVALGVPAERVQIAGNTKFDVTPSIQSAREAEEIHAAIFSKRLPCLVLGSLRPGEEDVWFPAISSCLAAGLSFQVIVAPRHAEKFDYFARRLEAHKLEFRRWSAPDAGSHAAPVFLLDTMGELQRVYACARVAFVGGTLLEGYGGHNPLEPAVHGVPVVLGPFGNNIIEVVRDLEREGAYLKITNQNEAAEIIRRMCKNDPQLEIVAARGRCVWQRLGGATSKILAVLPLS